MCMQMGCCDLWGEIFICASRRRRRWFGERGKGGRGGGILLAWALSRASRERHHVSVHLADFLFADQPTLRTERFGVREDVRVMVVDMCGGTDYGLRESEIC